MSKITNLYAEEILDIVRDATPHVALYEGDPEGAGTEVSGGSYARQPVTFTAVSSKSTSNNAELRWESMPESTVTHVAIYDDASAGNLRISGQVVSVVELTTGDETFISEGNLTLTASGA